MNAFGTSQIRIKTYKNEAKLLVMATQNNLDVIELCQIIKHTEKKTSVKKLAIDLEVTHKKIFIAYEDLAEVKLISIPKQSSIIDSLDYKSHNISTNENLNLITKKINKQIELLNELSKTTNSKDFGDLSTKANSVLKLKLAKTKATLKSINTNKAS